MLKEEIEKLEEESINERINKVSELEDIQSHIKELNSYCNELKRISESREYCMNIWSDRLEKNLSGLADYNDGKNAGLIEGKNIGLAEGKNIGLAEGKNIGLAEGKREMIINMFNNNVSLEEIAKYANLDICKVQNIINSKE